QHQTAGRSLAVELIRSSAVDYRDIAGAQRAFAAMLAEMLLTFADLHEDGPGPLAARNIRRRAAHGLRLRLHQVEAAGAEGHAIEPGLEGAGLRTVDVDFQEGPAHRIHPVGERLPWIDVLSRPVVPR